MTLPKPMIALLLLLGAHPGHAQSPCECVDAYDLASRRAEATAAIEAYRVKIEEWARSGQMPRSEESIRQDLQSDVRDALKNVRYANATPARGETRPNLLNPLTCEVINSAVTSCMAAAVDTHESLHAARCSGFGPGRFADLGDYAREEIEAYQKELAWVNAEYARLAAECELEVSLDSTIYGSYDLSKSVANARFELRLDDDGYFSGDGLLQYSTTYTGPPKWSNQGYLEQLLRKSCSQPPAFAWEGSGVAPIAVPKSAMMWARDPASNQLHVFVDLNLHVGDTRETRRLKSGARCAPWTEDEDGAFFSEAFYSDKRQESVGGIRTARFSEWYVEDVQNTPAELEFRHDWRLPSGSLNAWKSLEDTRLVLRLK